MEGSDGYEIAKMEIRGLLISNKEGCSLSEFKKQYRSMLGRSLPYAQFGCKDEIDFLSSMPDAVQIYSKGRDYQLFGVADAKSKHIQKMVAKQKPSKKKPSSRLNPMCRLGPRVSLPPPPSVYKPPSSVYKPSSSASKKSYDSRPLSSASKSLPSSSASRRSYDVPPRFQAVSKIKNKLPKSMIGEIIDLVCNYPAGLSLRDVLVNYRNVYEKELAFKDYGFFTLQECLEEIPSIILKPKLNDTLVFCSLESEKSYSESSKMRNDVSEDKSAEYTDDSHANNQLQGGIKYVDYEYFKNKSFPTKEVLEAAKTSAPVVKGSDGADSPNHLYAEGPAHIPSPHESTANCNGYESVPASNLSMKANQMDDVNSNMREDSEDSSVSEIIRNNLIRVVENCPHGIWAREFPALYKEVTKAEFNLHNLGFYDLATFIDSVPDILTRRSLPNSKKDYLIYPAWTRNEMDREDPKSAAFAIEIIIGNTRKILQANEEGIPLKEFLYNYSINCSEPLYYVQLGFDSLENLLHTIADRVPLKFTIKEGIKTVCFVFSEDISLLPPPINLESLPPNIVSPFKQFTRQTLPTHLDLGNFIPVYVCSVITPEHIYIQLEEASETLTMKYKDLEAFYTSSQSKRYVMKDGHIAAGSIGVAQWPSDMHWYRISVMSVTSPETVRVFYVDYGTIEIIPKSLLRYMREDFFDLPTQAIKASLAYVKPPFGSNTWDSKAKARILDLCTDLTIMAKINDIKKDGLLSLVLCDTNGEEDVYINDVLLKEGLARQATEADNYHYRNPHEPQIPLPSVPASNLPSTSANQPLLSPNPSTDPSQVLGMLLQAYSSLATNQGSSIPPSNVPVDPALVSAIAQAAQNLSQSPSASNANHSKQFHAPPASIVSPIPSLKPLGNDNWQYPSTSMDLLGENGSSEESDVFDDEVDAFFDEFYQKVSLVTKRYVKRIRTDDGYMFHILIYESKPFVSCGDICNLIWSNKDSDYLLQRLQNRESILPNTLIWKNKNEEMFDQLDRFHVKGEKKLNDQSCILVYPLNTLIQILNIFGHPSSELRRRILSESSSFNAIHPMWMELSEVEIPDGEEEFAGKTDDDKLNRLCLYDLQTMKQGIRIRRQNLELKRSKSPEDVSDELEKLRLLYNKVISRIKEIQQICSNFSDA